MAERAAEYVRQLVGREFKTLAIICKTAAHAKQFGELMRQHLCGCTLLTNRNEPLTSSVTILPSYLAKGLEFDVAILVGVDADRYSDSEYDAKLLYIGITRALHHLIILWSGQPSPVLPPITAK